MTEKEQYQSTVKAHLADWQAQIGQLKARLDKPTTTANTDYEQHFKELTRSLEEIQRKLQQLQRASEIGWEGLKLELDKALIAWRSNFEQIQAEILKTDEPV
ncbi:MAG: hypothetical protein HC875_11100 [Anaerolineales bacterium]|nr:hypothetical protein [Anaerolineales bacterium]